MGRSYNEKQLFFPGSLLCKHPENTLNHQQLPDKLQSMQERMRNRGRKITHPLKRWEDGEAKLYARCKSRKTMAAGRRRWLFIPPNLKQKPLCAVGEESPWLLLPVKPEVISGAYKDLPSEDVFAQMQARLF